MLRTKQHWIDLIPFYCAVNTVNISYGIIIRILLYVKRNTRHYLSITLLLAVNVISSLPKVVRLFGFTTFPNSFVRWYLHFPLYIDVTRDVRFHFQIVHYSVRSVPVPNYLQAGTQLIVTLSCTFEALIRNI